MSGHCDEAKCHGEEDAIRRGASVIYTIGHGGWVLSCAPNCDLQVDDAEGQRRDEDSVGSQHGPTGQPEDHSEDFKHQQCHPAVEFRGGMEGNEVVDENDDAE
nr:hypothetical protein CFP56_57055 [Quercus suber]